LQIDFLRALVFSVNNEDAATGGLQPPGGPKSYTPRRHEQA